MNRILFFTIFLFACSSKRNSEILPPPAEMRDTTLTLSYRIMLSDTAMNSITLKLESYFPDGSLHVPEGKSWSRQEFSDTMYFASVGEFYSRCRAQLSVAVNLFRIDTTRNLFMRAYTLPADTMNGTADTLIVFHWPADTLRAISTQEWYYN
jgi:hypothetical protein